MPARQLPASRNETMKDMDSIIRKLQGCLLRPELLQGTAYPVPQSEGLIKLDAMENPHDLPEALRWKWLDSLSGAMLNRYPDAHPDLLMDQIKLHGEIPPTMGLVLGNGSDELIQILITAVAGTGRPVLAAEPSFAMYSLLAGHLGLPFVGVPLDSDFRLDRTSFIKAMEQCNPSIVFLDWPNNPSGRLFPAEDLEAIVEAAPGLVVVDEAYHAFSRQTFAGHLGHHPNLLLLRTLSKEGLAGLRLGYLAGPRIWTEQMDKLRLPYNINILTQRSALFFLGHSEIFSQQADEIREQRDWLYGKMLDLGIKVWPSRTNFLLFHLPGKAAAVHSGLRERGILIKLFTDHPCLSDHLRVSVGTRQENGAFLAALESLL